MRPVAPRLVGLDEEAVGEESETYRTVTVAIGTTGLNRRCLITRWRLSDLDRARIAVGEDVFAYVTADTLPPIFLTVGSEYHELEPTP